MLAYSTKESFRNDCGIRGRRNLEASYPVDHFTQSKLTRDFQSALILGRDAVGVLMQHHEITLCITLKNRMVINVGDCCGPGCLKVSCGFLKSVWQTLNPALVFDYGHAFHQVGYSDRIALNGDIERSGRGTVAGSFAEGIILERIYHDLVY